MLAKTKPLTIVLIVLAIAILPLVPFALIGKHVDPRYANLYSVTAQKNLRIHAGDLSPEQLQTAPWRSADEVRKEYGRRPATGYFWLALELPANRWRDPNVFVEGLLHYELYLDGDKLLERNMMPLDRKVVSHSNLGRAPLPMDMDGHTLYIRMYKDNELLSIGWVYIQQYQDVFGTLFWQSAYEMALGFTTLLIGAGALLFFFSKRERNYLIFAMFALYIAYVCLGRMFPFVQLYFNTYAYVYYVNAMMPLGVMWFLLFYESVFGPGYRSIIRRLWQGMLAAFVLELAAALFDPGLYRHADTILNYLMLPIILVVLLQAVVHYLRRKTTESLWYLAGFAVLGPMVAIYSLASVSDRWPMLYRLVMDQSRFMHAFFVLIFCMGMVLRERVKTVYRQVGEHAAELERKSVRLAELDRLKDDFLANTSHELRTPLNGIIGIADTLARGAAGPVDERIADQLQMIAVSGKRLAHMVDDILDISKIKHGDLRLSRAPLALAPLAHVVATIVEPLARGKRLRLDIDIPDDAPLVFADENRIQQVLFNLLGNAVKHTEAGDIRLFAKSTDRHMYVSVADTGPGIDPADVPRLFEPFEQGETSQDGAGLGLPIAKKLVELHGGTLTCSSAPGSGSVFTFSLPIADASLAAAAAEPAPQQVAAIREPAALVSPPVIPDEPTEPNAGLAGEPPTILIVDDDAINRQVLANLLSMHGLAVSPTEDGRQALDWIDRHGKPDMVIADIMMPAVNGYELCRELRRSYSASALPVLLLTAKSGPADIAAGFAEGANDYLTKPVIGEDLIARVRVHLQLSRLTGSLERLVLERTAELEHANRHLIASVNETALALAEVSVLEERNRIAHDMHDQVGHTLTAAMIQIEAAKLLLASDPERAATKLDAARESVHGGLDQVRATVRMLRTAEEHRTLLPALHALIRQTEEHTGIAVDYTIEPLPDLPDALNKTLFHALQEGLTNGIRHGKSKAFTFHLSAEASPSTVRFRLANVGRKFESASHGFGLSAMKERVERHGGTFAISADGDSGCLLAIDIPLA
ncbi:MAG: response regulator [Paenibacillaceae bacterium]|nr:response regulator [Paenibacillaceae bacterium]